MIFFGAKRQEPLSGFVIGIVLTTVWWSSGALACNCSGTTLQGAFNESKVVILAKVESIGSIPEMSFNGLMRFDGSVATVHVQRSWKGPHRKGAKLFVATPSSGAMCGYPFSTGGRYLLYATVLRSDTLVTSICDRTMKANRAGQDMAKLDKLTSRKHFWTRMR